MDPNTHSTSQSTRRAAGPPDNLAMLTAALDGLAAQDLERLTDTVLAERVLALRQLVDRLEGHWLKELAGVDARGAAGAGQGQEVGSTAAWLRTRLRLGAGAAAGQVRTARAPVPGSVGRHRPGPDQRRAVARSCRRARPRHQTLPEHVTAEAEPVLVEAARRLDPPRLRRVLGHLRLVADPDGADRDRERRQQRRGLWLAATLDGMVASTGCWSPRPARPYWRLWNRWLVRPAPRTSAAVASAALMPWPSWPAAAWKQADSPRPVGSGRS
jgi:hypothetical protein